MYVSMDIKYYMYVILIGLGFPLAVIVFSTNVLLFWLVSVAFMIISPFALFKFMFKSNNNETQ